MFPLLVLLISSSLADDCVDKSPYCNTNDCTVRPGYAREYCRKTCGNCSEVCQNSHFVSCKEERKSECDSMLKDYCPLLCGVCRAVKRKPKAKQPHPETTTPRPTTLTFTPLLTTTVSVIPSTMNISQLAEQSRTSEPYVMPPMFRNNDLRRSPIRHSQLLSNTLEAAAEPLNIDEEANDIEWVHEPSTVRPNFTSQFIPEPEPFPIYYPQQRYQPQAPMNHQQQSYGSVQQWNRGYNGYGGFPRPQPTYGNSYGVRRSPNNHYGSSNGMIPSLVNQPGYRSHPQMGYPRSRPSSPFLAPSVQSQPYMNAPYGYAPPQTENPMQLTDLITLLGCRDRDPSTCSKITEETCYSRPGFYLKLCPVRCKNCNGLQCYDSIKVDCDEVRRMGGCRLPTASEYCPRTCQLCPPPAALADSLSVCKDELETCEQLSKSGVCDHPHSRDALRQYCAKSCGFCKQPQYYLDDTTYYKTRAKKSKVAAAKTKKN